MGDTISLSEARAVKEKDGRLWSVTDCLRAVLRDLESGEIEPVDVIYIAMARLPQDGSPSAFPYYSAGARRTELKGVMAQHLHDLCESNG